MKDRIIPNVVFHIVLVTEIQFCMTYPSGTLPPYLLLLKIEKKIWLTKYGQMGLELSKVFRNQSFPKIKCSLNPSSFPFQFCIDRVHQYVEKVIMTGRFSECNDVDEQISYVFSEKEHDFSTQVTPTSSQYYRQKLRENKFS